MRSASRDTEAQHGPLAVLKFDGNAIRGAPFLERLAPVNGRHGNNRGSTKDEFAPFHDSEVSFSNFATFTPSEAQAFRNFGVASKSARF